MDYKNEELSKLPHHIPGTQGWPLKCAVVATTTNRRRRWFAGRHFAESCSHLVLWIFGHPRSSATHVPFVLFDVCQGDCALRTTAHYHLRMSECGENFRFWDKDENIYLIGNESFCLSSLNYVVATNGRCSSQASQPQLSLPFDTMFSDRKSMWCGYKMCALLLWELGRHYTAIHSNVCVLMWHIHLRSTICRCQ